MKEFFMDKIANNVVNFKPRVENQKRFVETRRKALMKDIFCPKCGVVLEGGVWRWGNQTPLICKQALCPACQQIKEEKPAGFLSIKGSYFQENRSTMMSFISRQIEEQLTQKPLSRLMSLEELSKEMVILSFTDSELPQLLAEAIAQQFEALVDSSQANRNGIVRVSWC
jgi:hypothetical protein